MMYAGEPNRAFPNPEPRFRAYDTVTEWSGPPRSSSVAAERDASDHNDGCAAQGGYGSAIAVQNCDGRLETLDGETVWPPHGRSTGAARWR